MISNKSDFKTHFPGRMPRSGGLRHAPTGVVWGGIGPGAPRVCRAWSVPRNNRTRNPRTKTTKNEIQGMIDRTSNEQGRNNDE